MTYLLWIIISYFFLLNVIISYSMAKFLETSLMMKLLKERCGLSVEVHFEAHELCIDFKTLLVLLS